MPGRIETYVHSDNSTRNKAASMVLVKCQTDFGAKTDAFIDFARDVAKYACAFQTENFEGLAAVADAADLAGRLKSLEEDIKEKVTVEEIRVAKVAGGDVRPSDFPTGSMVVLNDLTYAVLGRAGDAVGGDVVPEDHLALWSGENGGEGPVLYTVPAEYCKPYAGPVKVVH